MRTKTKLLSAHL